jgi:hypothetical protein
MEECLPTILLFAHMQKLENSFADIFENPENLITRCK